MNHRFNVFEIENDQDFEKKAIEIFHYQSSNCAVYKEYLTFLNVDIPKIERFEQIPFLPIEFFKTHQVICENPVHEIVFKSSGTSGLEQSRHFVKYKELYEKSFIRGFELFYGEPENFTIFALLPSYLERDGSSLVYMAERLIEKSKNAESGFYLYDFDRLNIALRTAESNKHRTLLLGVSFALQDFFEQYPMHLKNTVIMETGGMKGRKKEPVREEFHAFLKEKSGVSSIHSEYGMTELLSQAYSDGKGIFRTPPWMRVLIRDTYDPFCFVRQGITGGLNVIDLANMYSCSFIETKDLAKKIDEDRFEVLGRFDSSEVRGCNLLVV